MRRRQFLGMAGAIAGGFAGCLGRESDDGSPSTDSSGFDPVSGGPRNGDQLPDDETSLDGYPPSFSTSPPSRSVDTDRFRTMTINPDTFQSDDPNGVVVPLVPIDVAYYWYWARSARFVDARATGGFENSHVFGAVSSPAPAGGEGDDPVIGWPTGDRIVCYCGCPHHLSGMRAASLLGDGYEQVYVIDEGFWAWHDRGYPMAGDAVDARPSLRIIEGVTDPSYAGGTVWAVHRPTNQVEAGPISSNGTFRLELRFAAITAASPVTVETPGYTVTAPIGELTAGPVTE